MRFVKVILASLLAVIMLFGSAANAVAAAEADDKNKALIEIQDFFHDIFRRLGLFFSVGYSHIDTDGYMTDSLMLQGLDDGFIPQGMCYVESLSCFAVSGYMDDKSDSRIYLIRDDAVGEIHIKGFNGHAGGIASNEGDIFVCSGGSEKSGGYIYRLSADELKSSFGSDAITVEFKDKIKTFVKTSFMCCENGMLWVGEFYNRDNRVNLNHYADNNRAMAAGYSLPIDSDWSGEEVLPSVVLSIPDQVQGMSIADSGEVVFSTSYGRRNDSAMYVFKDYKIWKTGSVNISGESVPLYISGRDSRIMRFKMPTLMEGIDIYDGSLYVVFESGANKYSDAKEIIKNIKRLDIKSIIKED